MDLMDYVFAYCACFADSFDGATALVMITLDMAAESQ